jgi:hypothetical protein
MSENNTTTTVEITTPVVAVETVETPVVAEAVQATAAILEADKQEAVSIRDRFQARFKGFSTFSLKTPMEIGIACLICLIVGALTPTTLNAASIAAAEQAKVRAVEEADKAVRVAKAEAGVPPTFLQSLYGVTVRPVSDAAQYSYGAAKNADGRAYGAVTSTFQSGSSEAPTVKVVAQAPAATK